MSKNSKLFKKEEKIITILTYQQKLITCNITKNKRSKNFQKMVELNKVNKEISWMCCVTLRNLCSLYYI